MTIQERIYQDISAKINRDEFSDGDRLPSLRVLSSSYDSSTSTIRQVIDRLRAEGRLYSRHGKGNFISSPIPRTRTIMLITRLEGDLFADFTRYFSTLFSQNADCQLVLEQPPLGEKSDTILRRKIDLALTAGNLDAIIFEGTTFFHTDFLRDYLDRVRIYCFFDNAKLTEFMCPYVSTDWLHGGYIGINHLREAGCRNPLVITSSSSFRWRENNVYKFLDGCRQAAQEQDILLHELRHQSESPDYVAAFTQVLAKNPDIDGVFAFGDFRLPVLFPVIRQLGYTIGQDFAALGYYDTPWARATDPELSSVNVRPKAIVEEIGNLYLNSEYSYKHKLIPPEIVIRSSTRNMLPHAPA